MKVIAYFQFYLPYLLPRHDDWKGQSLRLKTPEFEIVVSPRACTEPVILPNDSTVLSTRLKFKSVADEHSAKNSTAEDKCCDRLQVAVTGEVADVEATRADAIREKFLDTAIEGGNIFIEHCRVLSMQPGMLRLTRNVVSAGITSPGFPYSLWWQDAKSRAWLHGTTSLGAVSALLQNPVSWRAIMSQVERSISPELPRTLMLDARHRFYGEDLPASVLSMAMACEVAGNLYVENMGASEDREVEKILSAKGNSFAERYFHLSPLKLSSRSLKTERPDIFSRLERLYRVRNAIAHAGVLAEDGRIVDRHSAIRVVHEFLDAAEETLRWVSALAKPAASAAGPTLS